MNKIGKYEFNSLVQADDMINALEESSAHKHCIIKLGFIVLEQAEYNEDGEETKAPVLSDKYHVDVLWKGLDPVDAEAEVLSYVEPNGWIDNRIDLDNNGVHSFMGLDYNIYKFKV